MNTKGAIITLALLAAAGLIGWAAAKGIVAALPESSEATSHMEQIRNAVWLLVLLQSIRALGTGPDLSHLERRLDDLVAQVEHMRAEANRRNNA